MKNSKLFINCPYDKEYNPLFQILVYFSYLFSHEPCFCSEDYSSSSRMNKIIQLIKETDIGIHDISRITLSDGYPRFNMPFELGMDYFYSEDVNKQKKLLVLDDSDGTYRKTLSDLNCSDIGAHNKDPKTLINILRNFFISLDNLQNVPSSDILLKQYRTIFKVWLSNNLKNNGIKGNKIAMSEFKAKVKLFFDGNYVDCPC